MPNSWAPDWLNSIPLLGRRQPDLTCCHVANPSLRNNLPSHHAFLVLCNSLTHLIILTERYGRAPGILPATLVDRLLTVSGISGSALSWISSYLTNRTQSVLVSGKYSDPAHLRYGVPQGSVLGPALFSDYSSPIASLIRSFKIIAHCGMVDRG